MCYYLGKYPWYWDHTFHSPHSPYDSWSVQKYIYYNKVSTAVGEYIPVHLYTEEDLLLFFGPEGKKDIDAQVAFLNGLDGRHGECFKRKYVKPPKEPQATVITPKGPSNWPGVSWSDIKIPTPEGRPLYPPKQILRLTYEIIPSTIKDGLMLTLEYLEVKR